MSSPPAGTGLPPPPPSPTPASTARTAAPPPPLLPPPPPPTAQKPPSGFRSALRYTGIPPSWLDKRPKLPSRNWLIFLSLSSSLIGLYAYDRRRCRQIRDEYVRRVEHLAQEPMHPQDVPRKVTVYASKWPGDEDYTKSVRWFKKYVKPILVAAAIDYDILGGKRHGDLARALSDQIKTQRRIDLGLEKPANSNPQLSWLGTPEEARARALKGGSIIIGRMTFKEYMEGLRRGWTEPPTKVDREEVVAHALEDDDVFDEPETNDPSSHLDGEPMPTKTRLISSQNAQSFSPLKLPPSTPTTSPSPSSPADTAVSYTPPEKIPPQPPLLLVPFTNYIGFRQIPLMLVDFFNQRQKVQAGAEAAYKLVLSQTRPFTTPPPPSPNSSLPIPEPLFDRDLPAPSQPKEPTTDLNFDRPSESNYPPSTITKFLSNIDKAREEYYNELLKRLATARALARGEREPTKEEVNYPPPSEVELRAERLKKELRWRGDVEGWRIVRPEAEVVWDERFKDALKVFVEPSDGNDENSV